MPRVRHLVPLAMALTLPAAAPQAASTAHPAQPNILLLLADDLGYSDLGCYGGEIDTPHIDRLAGEGVRFSHFRATPMCVTSRVALHSGMPFWANGGGRYDRVLPLPEALRSAGYFTGLTGKWHAGDPHPASKNFYDRFFGFLGGMTDAFAGGNDWFDNRERFHDFANDFHATDAIANAGIAMMSDAASQRKPFFVAVMFNAPHHPLQARRETYEKYLGRYLDGFQNVRKKRIDRQRKLGLLDPRWTPARPEEAVRRWEEMTPRARRIEDMRMAAYAAMVDEMDQAVGRILAFLDNEGLAQNTLVLFASDNGGYFNNGSHHHHASHKPWLPGSNQSLSSGWGWVSNSPFRLYKQTCYEGGLAVPMIMRWPDHLAAPKGAILDIKGEMTDLYPTFLELAGTDYPESWNNTTLKPLTGISLAPALLQTPPPASRQTPPPASRQTPPLPAPPRFHWFEHSRAWIEDGFKAVTLYDGPWKLFNLAADRTEQHNLADSQPDLVASLASRCMDAPKSYQIPRDKRLPATDIERGWGWHRLKMALPNLTSLSPDNALPAPADTRRLVMKFSSPVQPGDPDSKVQLFRTDSNQPVWECSPNPSHFSDDSTTLSFPIPPLEPDTQYFVLIDPDTLRIHGRPNGPVNDGAYWWRFRTNPARPGDSE